MSRGRANRAIGKITGASMVTQHGSQEASFQDEPITLREGDNLSVTLGKTGVAVHVDSAPPGAFWNAIARAWFVDVDGETIRLDPQPLAPSVHGLVPSPRIDL